MFDPQKPHLCDSWITRSKNTFFLFTSLTVSSRIDGTTLSDAGLQWNSVMASPPYKRICAVAKEFPSIIYFLVVKMAI